MSHLVNGIFVLLREEKNCQIWKRQSDRPSNLPMVELGAKLFNRLVMLRRIESKKTLLLLSVDDDEFCAALVGSEDSLPKIIYKNIIEETCARGLTDNSENKKDLFILGKYDDLFIPSYTFEKPEMSEEAIKRIELAKLYTVTSSIFEKDYPKMFFCQKCGIVRSQHQRCSRCRKVHYCSREHQEADWENHKQICKSKSK